MSRIKNTIMDAVALNKLDNQGVADLIRYLEEDWNIRYSIWLEMEEYYRKKDLEYGVDQYNQIHNTNHEFNESEMNLMLEDFNDVIYNSDEWFYTRMCVVERWCRDKEEKKKKKMIKYNRKYYINNQEISFENLMKYIEIKLQYDNYPLDALGIRFETIKEEE